MNDLLLSILWLKCHEREMLDSVSYKDIPWFYLLIQLMGYNVSTDTLLSEYQYYNPLF